MNLKKLTMMALTSLLVIGANATAADIKMGYVDMQKAIQETSTGKKAKKELEKETNSKKEVFEKKKSDIKKMQEDMEKKKAVLSEDARNKKAAELNQEMMAFQQQISEGEMALRKKEQDLVQPIIEKLGELIEKMGREQGYTMIVEKNSGVLFAKKEIDLTDELIKAYEKTLEKK